jgi:hypothetical protein
VKRLRPWLTTLGLVAFATWFAAANGGQHVSLHLGLFTIRSMSVPALVFSSVILGMVVVLLTGLRADLRTRGMLRRYREVLEKEE